jgi:predicted amidohydrolase YtcJ
MVGWHIEETISLEQALKGFTTNVAWAGFMEGKAGIIAPGAWADWVVLDEDLFEMDIERLRTLAVKETWVGGKKVFPVDKAPADRGWLRLKEYL